jgi:hypothetical protein
MKKVSLHHSQDYILADSRLLAASEEAVPSSKDVSSGSAPSFSGATASGKTSLPSQEQNGAQPGEETAGAGALPGKLSESGVAVLPEEKGRSRAAPNAGLS